MAAGVLLTQTEAAAYLGASRNKVREWTRNGLLPTFQDCDGGRILYPRLALDAWQDELGRITAHKAEAS